MSNTIIPITLNEQKFKYIEGSEVKELPNECVKKIFKCDKINKDIEKQILNLSIYFDINKQELCNHDGSNYYIWNKNRIEIISQSDKCLDLWENENKDKHFIWDGKSFVEVTMTSEHTYWARAKKIHNKQLFWNEDYKLWGHCSPKKREGATIENWMLWEEERKRWRDVENEIYYDQNEQIIYIYDGNSTWEVENDNNFYKRKDKEKAELPNSALWWHKEYKSWGIIDRRDGEKYEWKYIWLSKEEKWLDINNKLYLDERQKKYYVKDLDIYWEVEKRKDNEYWQRKDLPNDELSKNELPKDANIWFVSEQSWGKINEQKSILLWDKEHRIWWDKNKSLFLNQQETFYILKTGISPVHRLDRPKEIITDSEFDDLLNGGILLPKNMLDIWLDKKNDNLVNPHGIVIILTGAPGSGKTTFALELCTRFVKGVSVYYKKNAVKQHLRQRTFNCIYITNEDTLENINAKINEQIGNIEVKNKKAFDEKYKEFDGDSESKNVKKESTKDSSSELYCIDKIINKDNKNNLTKITKIKVKEIFSILLKISKDNLKLNNILFFIFSIISSIVCCAVLSRQIDVKITQIMPHFNIFIIVLFFISISPYIFKKIFYGINSHDRDIIASTINDFYRKRACFDRPFIAVLDSLNTIIGLDKELNRDNHLIMGKRFDLFDEVTYKLSQTFPISIIMMDTGPGFSPDHKWSSAEYMADLEINFSYDSPENYMIRRLWIVKARYQSHADGFQRIKIDGSGNMEDEQGRKEIEKMGKVKQKKYATSYFPEGGIHIFSSIHRYLSEARRDLEKGNENNKTIPTPYPALNKAISSDNSTDDGIKPGHCVCIIGDRGTMKSHMAYRMILDGLWENKKGVIISLRDPRDQVYDQLNKIIDKQGLPEEWKRNLQDFIDVLYFWPGYISPDEFLHIVKVAVADDERQYVVINGLEQLPARFPLCAQEKMFISGLLSYLTSRHKIVIVTSSGKIDKPSEDGGVPDGLLPMGDIIMQGSVEDIAPKLIWSDYKQSDEKNNDIDDLWSSAVDKEYWNRTGKANEQYREKMDFYQRRANKLKNLRKSLEEKYRDEKKITQPHVVYDIVRGATGFRECRMRLLCYVTREDDKKLAINAILENNGIEYHKNYDKDKFLTLFDNIQHKKNEDKQCYIRQIRGILGGDDTKAKNILKIIQKEENHLPQGNQVFLARIPEGIASKIFTTKNDGILSNIEQGNIEKILLMQKKNI